MGRESPSKINHSFRALPVKILLVHRYYWPDTPPYAIILKKIGARLASDGHDVDVLSTQPGYKPEVGMAKQDRQEEIDGCSVRRMSLLPSRWKIPGVGMLNMLLFSLGVVLHALKKRDYDVIMIATSPPVLAGWSARIASKICGARLLYHCMDIHPEIGRLSGEFSNKWVFNFLQRQDLKTCQFASRVIVLSEDMKKAILSRNNSEGCQIDVLPNFSLDQSDASVPAIVDEYRKSPGVFRLVFAGNIGRFQGLPQLIDTFSKIGPESPVELVLLGDGKQKAGLIEQVERLGISNVRFIPHQPMEIANAVIQSSDLGVVTLNPEVYRYAYPTKMIAYLSVGCPILSMVELDSELAKFVEDRKIGHAIGPQDSEALTRLIDRLAQNPNQLEDLRENANRVYTDYHGEAEVLDKWSFLINSLKGD